VVEFSGYFTQYLYGPAVTRDRAARLALLQAGERAFAYVFPADLVAGHSVVFDCALSEDVEEKRAALGCIASLMMCWPNGMREELDRLHGVFLSCLESDWEILGEAAFQVLEKRVHLGSTRVMGSLAKWLESGRGRESGVALRVLEVLGDARWAVDRGTVIEVCVGVLSMRPNVVVCETVIRAAYVLLRGRWRIVGGELWQAIVGVAGDWMDGGSLATQGLGGHLPRPWPRLPVMIG
jgi:hypothetical protein